MQIPECKLKHWVLSHLILAFLLLLALIQLQQIIDNNLKLSILNIGQGDSILIQTPEYKNILTDAGMSDKVVDELGKQLGFFDKTIDLFIMTHPDRDHYAGILDVLQKYEIKQVMITGISNPDPLYESFLEQIQSKNIPIIFPQNDEDMQIGQNTYLDIIYPFAGQSLVGQAVKNKNDTSVVTRLTDSDYNSLALLTGDAEHALEKEILLEGQYVQSPILKLGHHGAKTSTSIQFLSAVHPQTAVISAGEDNQFGHPHKETMEKVDHLEVLQTSEGTITFNF